MADERLLLGEIVAAHGIKGLVKVRSFTQAPEDVVAYGSLHDGGGKVVELSLRGPTKGGMLAAVPGVSSRTDAEAMKGTQLFVTRDMLPELPHVEGGGTIGGGAEEFYHADLIGLAVELPNGTAFGRITAMHNFGAGDLLELQPAASKETIMVPFNRDAVPVVDLANSRAVVAGAVVNDDDGDDE